MIDERSAGFVALGMAKASGRPVAVTCTSGTAAANLHPAVVEAWEARVPLIVLTADRPPELREVGAGQAIDQLKLYGSAAKWFVEVGTHEPGRETAVHHRALACRAYWTALGGRPGPVHLNVPLREPLAPAPEELAAEDWAGRPGGRPWTELREHASAPHADDVHRLAERIAAPSGGRSCAVPGRGGRCRARRPARGPGRLAAARRAHLGRALRRPRPLPRGRALRRDPARGGLRRAATCPSSSCGSADMPTSKPLRAFVAAAPQVVIDPHAVWHEPTRRAELMLASAAAPTLDALASAVEMRASERDPPGSPRGAPPTPVPAALADAPEDFEPKLLAGSSRSSRRRGRLAQLLDADPRRGGLVPAVGQAHPLPRQPRRQRDRRRDLVGARRGHRATEPPDLAPDRRARAPARPRRRCAARRAGAPLEIVCIDNGGGGIFDFLPVAEHADPAAYESHVATPAGAAVPLVNRCSSDRTRTSRSTVAGRVSGRRTCPPGRSWWPSSRASSAARRRGRPLASTAAVAPRA